MTQKSQHVDQIGWTAGKVWNHLCASGAISNAKLVKEIDEPRDTVMQALGWLAREGKVQIHDTKRGRLIELVRREAA